MDQVWLRLTQRPFVCVHADVHRKNMIVDGGFSTFLDWELALWGDPVYDLAVHIHKMAYLPEEHEALVSRWLADMPADHTTGWEHDLDAYLAHERIKSAIVDAVRYSQAFTNDGPFPYPPPQVITMMTAKINAARAPWGIEEPITPDAVANAFQTRTPRPR
jgi:aminoglycoside phosphotransferase (APT) family kinase protein